MEQRITVTQNRAFETGLKIINDGENYYLTEGEKLIFGVKRFVGSREYLIRKVLTAEDYNADADCYPICLNTEETDLAPGIYYYDVALQRSDGEMCRVIGCTELEIVRSVVRSDDPC